MFKKPSPRKKSLSFASNKDEWIGKKKKHKKEEAENKKKKAKKEVTKKRARKKEKEEEHDDEENEQDDEEDDEEEMELDDDDEVELGDNEDESSSQQIAVGLGLQGKETFPLFVFFYVFVIVLQDLLVAREEEEKIWKTWLIRVF